MRWLTCAYTRNAWPSDRRLERHLTERDCRRAAFRLGSRIATNTAIMPITTSNSTSVKAFRRDMVSFPLSRADGDTAVGQPSSCVIGRIIGLKCDRGCGQDAATLHQDYVVHITKN